MFGSDFGHIFVSNKYTCRLVNVLQGDKLYSTLPMMVTAGIDYDI